MQLVANNQIQNQVIETNEVVKKTTSSFIEANTLKVSLEHLKKECIIPVFSKDNETTISHYQFVNKTNEIVRELFPQFIGKARMFNHLEKPKQKQLFPLALNDGQLNNVVKEYFSCPNFHREEDGSINLWNMYNLFTEANKSSYIDSNLERNVNAYEFINMLGNSIKNNEPNWYLHN
jgi:hypothetical protein